MMKRIKMLMVMLVTGLVCLAQIDSTVMSSLNSRTYDQFFLEAMVSASAWSVWSCAPTHLRPTTILRNIMPD